MKFKRQNVDAATGRSFECAFLRLLADHILKFDDAEMLIPEKERTLLKLTSAVSTLDAVAMMKRHGTFFLLEWF